MSVAALALAVTLAAIQHTCTRPSGDTTCTEGHR